MHYSTGNNLKVNSYIKNAHSFKGDGLFSRFTSRDTAIVSCPFGNQVKALFRFILVHCSHATVYEESKA
jgi:hypothetical protein